MQHKYRLNVSILLMSSLLIQNINAREKITENVNELLKNLVIDKGGTQRNVRTIWGISQNTKIERGEIKIVEYGSSVNATVTEGGKQVVMGGATAMNTKVEGGKQFVLGSSDFQSKKSSAYHAIISGKDGVFGQQNVYDGGESWYTKIMKGGEQNVYKVVQTKKGGTTSNTEVSENGRQRILAGGEAKNVTLKDDAVQIVYRGGVVDNLTISDSANSWVYVGATLTGKTIVNNSGHLHLYAGDPTSHITREDIIVTGQPSISLFSVGPWSDESNSQINIENLSGNGTVSVSSVGYNHHHLHLYVKSLSGSLHFQFNLSNMGGRSDYLLIDNGTGNHKISVTDSGTEIANFFLQKNHVVTGLNLITDKSRKAKFTLVNRSGQNTNAFDGGTYMYGLYSRESVKNGKNEKIWYLGANIPKTHRIRSRRYAGQHDFDTSVLSSESSQVSDVLTSLFLEDRVAEPKSRRRPPRHVRQHEPDISVLSSESPQVSDVLTTPSLQDQTTEPKPRRRAPRHVSQHELDIPVLNSESSQVTDPSTAPSLEDQNTQLKSRKRFPRHLSQYQPNSLEFDLEEPQASDFLTTPSTDAVLSLAVAPELVFNNELQSLRAGRGVLEKNRENTALWTYTIKNKEQIATGHTHFKLDQAGIMLGTDWVTQLLYGKLYIGGFGSYDQARINHARRGVSGMNTYSFGTYATYLNEYGWYLDSIVKYNRYQNHLKAVSTSGLAIQGDYNQWAIGTSLEGGYRFQTGQSTWVRPYSQFTWLQVKDKEIQLSNGMIGDISSSTSLRSEVGLSIRHAFNFNTNVSSLIGYVTAAWLREYIDNNHTMINKRHKFITDLSDNAGKLAIGLNSFVSKNLTFYTEAQYLKGHKMTQSLQGILGIRYSF
ncbi:BafA family autotransporter [Bartonella sp. WD12.1]|uniref:BafA family autotransporter n=1 Tax=Bartonella sp. WD12.1 TaxID=1933903 RepID=UPI00099A9224|nr:BafA family autotransporter [Bartonella sp. WD12.1]OPB29315.1 outer membrane autotransporter barrel domain-containing protein [Bartonella sp. WD12.1]